MFSAFRLHLHSSLLQLRRGERERDRENTVGLEAGHFHKTREGQIPGGVRSPSEKLVKSRREVKPRSREKWGVGEPERAFQLSMRGDEEMVSGDTTIGGKEMVGS